MKPCLHPSIVNVNRLEPYLDLASRHGYEWVDLSFDWIEDARAEHGDSYVEELFLTRGLSLASFGLPVNVYGDESDFVRDLAALPERVEFAVRLGATRCTTFLWPSIDDRPVPYASRLARRFRQCAVAMMPYGVRLGLEFVGPHHLRGKRFPFVQDMNELFMFIEAVGAPNVGMLLDSLHWYTAEVPEADIAALSASQIVHVHINDSSESPSEAHDQQRLMPGHGRIDLVAFLRAVYETGYRGPVSVEVLHQEPLPGDDDERAKDAFDQMNSIMKQARGVVQHG